MPVFRSLSPGQHKLYPAVPKTEAMKKALELSLSPGQHKLYPAVPKTEAMKKALELSISKAFMAEDMGLEPTGLLHLT